MIKKLEKIKYKKELKELKNKKFVGRHCDLIITCKRKEFNHYRGQTYKDLDSKSLASGGWKHKLSKGDYFTILPWMKVRDFVMGFVWNVFEFPGDVLLLLTFRM